MEIWIKNKHNKMTLNNYIAINRHQSDEEKTLLDEYNQTGVLQTDRRSEILHQMIPNCRERILLFEPPVYIENGNNISCVTYLFLNIGCVILNSAPVKFGDTCLVGPGVHIYATNWDYESNELSHSDSPAKPVTIGDRVWIGGKARIYQGVTIGNDSIIGAGSVVVDDVPANVVVCGIPAKIIRHLKN